MHALRRHDRRQRLVHVAAVEREIGRAVALLDRAPKRMIVGDRAGEPVAIERGGRAERDLTQPVLDAQTAMHSHRVGALLDAGAHPGEGLGLLVDLDRDAVLAQRRRRGKPADAGADDGDGMLIRHLLAMSLVVIPAERPGLCPGRESRNLVNAAARC
jgi:hypothetical protein